ncbi:PAQR family membrane homeostasis protein TrhA [Denitrobaculum tricleocarpae]|nr:hemolysin III family protein [Denitrobaculum tricleocarpae]
MDVKISSHFADRLSKMYIETFSREEERLNAATHGLGALLSVTGMIFLMMQAESVGRDGSFAAAAVYGAALIFLFLFSTLHHAVLRPRLKQFLLALDHCGIYLLIAGTYTPFCLLMPDGEGWELLALIWSLAFAGITVQMAAFVIGHSERYERFAYVFYLAMGWLPVFYISEVIFGLLAPTGLALLVAGGLAYSIGVIFYLWKSLRFGHAIWHLFVVAAAGFHFFSIYHYVVPKVI